METERRQYTPEPIEPESAIPYWIRLSCCLTLRVASDVFLGWMMINSLNSIDTLHYRSTGHDSAQAEKKTRTNGLIGIRKVDDFLYHHGEQGRKVTNWAYDKVAFSFD